MNSLKNKGIKFTTGKDGRKRAYYFSGANYRWMPCKLADAEMAVATGIAKVVA